MRAQSVHQLYPSKSFILKGPLKWLVLSTSVWNDFIMAATIVFTPKCPSECDYILFGTHRQLFGPLHSSTLRSSHSGGYRGIGMSPSEMKAGPISYKIKLECICGYDRSFTSEHSLDTRNSVVNKKQCLKAQFLI